MKGIILAGGHGTRLHPITIGVSKQLLPVYNKPMIYYPLSTLMLAGIQDILIITAPDSQKNFFNILGHGEQFGLNLSYATQEYPRGLVDAFIIGRNFIGESDVCLVLGDNIFYGQGFTPKLQHAKENNTGATVFAYKVKNPEKFGVVSMDKNGRICAIQEKPKNPDSPYAVTGLYFYKNNVVQLSKEVRYSERGELDITDLNNIYLNLGALDMEILGRGFMWMDAGTHDALLEAGNFVQAIEHNQNVIIACIEEIAYNNGWITAEELLAQIRNNKIPYYQYLMSIIEE